jgi:primary-amine oxidase
MVDFFQYSSNDRGHKIRLQQALMYYRPSLADNQYSLPFDFCPIVDTENGKVVTIDIPKIRRPIPKSEISQYLPGFIAEEYGNMRKDLKPLEVIQPEGVSFKLRGREIEWQNFKVISSISFSNDSSILDSITERELY